jgi:DNA polymerase III epsilon subunit-like protein
MKNMILVDLETQDFDVRTGIYEVACLVIEDYRVVDQLYLAKKIDGYTGSTRYGFGHHNISRDRDSIARFKAFLAKYPYPLVAHNAPFDRKFLLYYRWIDRNYPAYCSIQAIKREISHLRSYSLQNLIRHFNIGEEVDHTAMSDTMNLYKLLCIVRPGTWVPLGEAYNTGSFTG